LLESAPQSSKPQVPLEKRVRTSSRPSTSRSSLVFYLRIKQIRQCRTSKPYPVLATLRMKKNKTSVITAYTLFTFVCRITRRPTQLTQHCENVQLERHLITWQLSLSLVSHLYHLVHPPPCARAQQVTVVAPLLL